MGNAKKGPWDGVYRAFWELWVLRQVFALSILVSSAEWVQQPVHIRAKETKRGVCKVSLAQDLGSSSPPPTRLHPQSVSLLSLGRGTMQPRSLEGRLGD